MLAPVPTRTGAETQHSVPQLVSSVQPNAPFQRTTYWVPWKNFAGGGGGHHEGEKKRSLTSCRGSRV